MTLLVLVKRKSHPNTQYRPSHLCYQTDISNVILVNWLISWLLFSVNQSTIIEEITLASSAKPNSMEAEYRKNTLVKKPCISCLRETAKLETCREWLKYELRGRKNVRINMSVREVEMSESYERYNVYRYVDVSTFNGSHLLYRTFRSLTLKNRIINFIMYLLRSRVQRLFLC